MLDILIYAVLFLILIYCQSLFINGISYCFKIEPKKDLEGKMIGIDGGIFHKISFWINEREKNWFWGFIRKPLFACIRCMASFWGTLTYWSVALTVLGYHWQEVTFWIFDIGILISLNWIVYKKL